MTNIKELNEELIVLENRTQAMIKSIASLANDTELLRQKVMEVTKDESKRSTNTAKHSNSKRTSVAKKPNR